MCLIFGIALRNFLVMLVCRVKDFYAYGTIIFLQNDYPIIKNYKMVIEV
jgi:hypothetical protein